jgi:hypothetical protein
MSIFKKLFGGSSSQEPITLEFACSHPMENPRPPSMSAEEREKAQAQAKQVRCPACTPPQWQRYEISGAYPELRKAVQRRP